MNKSDESCLFSLFDIAQSLITFDCGKFDGVCSSYTDLRIITIFRYVKRSAIFFSNTCGSIVKKKKKEKKRQEKKTVNSTNED